MINDLKWVVTPKGFEFKIESKSNICFSNEWTNIIEYSSSTNITALQILLQLVDEDKAVIEEGNIVVYHHIVAQLNTDERYILSLPEPYPFYVEIRAIGNLSNTNFRYAYYFLNGKSQPFIHVKRIGAYLEISSEQTYLLSGELYYLIEAIDDFNNKAITQKNIKNNLLTFAKIKGLSKKTAVILDRYLNNEDVITPSKITLRLKKVNEDYVEIEPVLCEKSLTKEGIYVLKDLLYEKFYRNFLNRFDRFSKVRDVYSLGRGPKIVLNDEQKNALNQIKKYRHISQQKAKKIFQNPPQFFDPQVVDFETPLLENGTLINWSDRVIEIGLYQHRSFPFLRPGKEAWLPPEGGVVIDGTLIYLSPEDAKEFKKKLEYAIQTGKSEIVWKEQKIPNSAFKEALKAVTDLINVRPDLNTSSIESIQRVKTDNKKHVLIIKDNFEQLDYKTDYETCRPGGPDIPDIPNIPKALYSDVQLLPHQQEGLKWLQSLWINGAKGALLADDMGLGKTLQALSFMAWIQELMDKGLYSTKPMLIIAPVSLLENWKEEYRHFLNPIWGPFIELHGPKLRSLKNYQLARALGVKKEIEIKEKEDAEFIISANRGFLLEMKKLPKKAVVITTYETLRDYQFSFGSIEWSIIILDEAQKIKNPTALVTTSVKAMNYEFGIALTGTPVENSWVDLWSIIDFVQPGYLGSLKEFAKKYYYPLSKDKTNIKVLGQDLRKKVGSLIKRRSKEDHLQGLPGKKVIPYEVEMPSIQLEYYLGAVRKARTSLRDSLSIRRKQCILSLIAILRDISLHPYLPYFNEQKLAEFSDEDIISSSARLIKTIEILDDICKKEEKAIIFLISRKMQRILQRLINNRYQIVPYIINGTTNSRKRKSYINEFQNVRGFNVIIISPEAAGIGLNITAANHVIHLSRLWNPAKEDQATDRVYRIGQIRPVFVHIPMAVHHLLYNESFDQKLNRLLERKRELSKTFLLPPFIEESEQLKIGEEIINISNIETKKSYLMLTDLDNLSPEKFEEVIALFYQKMGYRTELTPHNCDCGADVVALGENNSILIQCKHTIHPEKPQNHQGIQEILAARRVYEEKYNTSFNLIVVTNACDFTNHAKYLAQVNNISLISRNELKNLMEQYPICCAEI